MQALGRGVSDLGQALFRIEQAEGVSQASTARGQVDARMRQLEAELKFNNDPDTYQAEKEKAFADIDGFRPKNRIGSGIFDDYVSRSIDGWSTGVNILALGKRKELIEGAYIGDWNNAVQKGDLVEADRLTIEARDETGAISPQEAANRLKESSIMVGRVLEKNAISNVYAAIEAASDLETGTGVFVTAKELAKSELIPEPRQATLRSAITSAETRFNRAKTSLNLAVQDQAMTDLITQLAKNPNAIGQEDFDALPLNDINKALLAEKINQRASVIATGKPDPWIESASNRAAASAISQVLDGTREEVSKTTVSEIIGQLGTITPKQASELIAKRTKRLDNTNVINTPAHKRAVGALNRLRNARLGADDIKDDIALRNEVEGEFGRMQNELESFAESIEDDPDFDKKILKKQQFLARPIVEEVTLNWFEKMFSPKEQGFFTGIGFNTEAEELIQEKFDILKDQKIWKTLNDAEKESIRKRFERGATVQDILDLVNGQ